MDVRAWAKGRAPDAAPDALAELPPSPGKPGRVAHPFPVGEESPYERRIGHRSLQRRIAHAPVEQVALANVVSNGQRTVELARVEHYLEHPGDSGRRHGKGQLHGSDKPIVVRVGGEHVLYDGTHRCTAAWAKGERFIEAKFVDLDAALPSRK